MELPQRARLPHEVPSWVADSSFFFLTINCASRGTNQLCRSGVGAAVLAAAAHNHFKFAWHCRLMLLMPDHLHAIIAFPREPGIKTTVANWKQYLAAHENIQWQRDFFDHRLRDHFAEQEKTSYILMNPVRRGLCERAEDWRWVWRPSYRLPRSSAEEAPRRDFADQ
jgi:REP element-mobilizing transposase RayT